MGDHDHATTNQQGGLDPRLRRLLDNKCRVARCSKPLKEGSVWCSDCDPDQRDRAAKRQAKRRASLAAQNLCIDGCGERRQKDGQRCRNCAREHRAACANRRECHAGRASVTPQLSDEPRTKLEVHKDGYVRERYIGRGVRGQKPRAALDADLRRQAREIAEHATHFAERGLTTLREIEASRPTNSQRQEARLLATDPLERAMRIAVGLIVAIRPGGRRAIEEWFELWKLGDEYGADGDE